MTTPRQFRIFVGGTALAIASAATPADALLIMDPASPSTPVSNTAPPSGAYADFGYWDNMLGAHTYLGNGYLLSTNHVGALPASITIQGTSYNRVAQQRLHEPGNPGTLTDLWAWRIDPSVVPQPTLPTVFPILAGPVSGETTFIIGDGHTRGGGPTFWDINYISPGNDNDVWTAGAPEATADAKGFLPSSTQQKEWGTNKIADPNVDIEIDATLTRGYTINFSQTDATEFETQATGHDSAGPVFVKRGGVWQLTGLMHTINRFDGEPISPSFAGAYYYTHPSAPGQVLSNSTYVSDLSEYTDQLVAFGVTVPEPSAAGLLVGGCAAMMLRRRRA